MSEPMHTCSSLFVMLVSFYTASLQKLVATCRNLLCAKVSSSPPGGICNGNIPTECQLPTRRNLADRRAIKLQKRRCADRCTYITSPPTSSFEHRPIPSMQRFRLCELACALQHYRWIPLLHFGRTHNCPNLLCFP